MITPPGRLTCFEFRRRLDGGITRPLLMTAADDAGNEHAVVLKLRHPDVRDGHYHGTSLACEMICSILARAIGLIVPDYFIVEIPRELLNALPDETLRRLLRDNIGANFGSAYQEGVTTWRPQHISNFLSEWLETMQNVLIFDSAIINGDRKINKPNIIWDGVKMLLIDHSIALPVHLWDDAIVATSPLFPEDQVRQHCTFNPLCGHNQQFNNLLEFWQSHISERELLAIRAVLPSNWERNAGDIDKIFGFLQARVARFAEVSTDLRRIVG